MIKVGTSGFSFPDWVGPVYPPSLKKDEYLAFYERELGFKITEINFTYYAIPSPKSFESMIKKTSFEFEFIVKAHKSMTHEIKDKRGALLDNRGAFEKFNASIDPLHKEGRLTCILAQFPYSFHANRENAVYLLAFKERLPHDIPLVIEFRNRRWHTQDVFQFLKKHEISYTIVDEPKLEGLMPYIPLHTTNLGYFRFHGRNSNWFDAPTSVRYDYLYSKEELETFSQDITKLDQVTDQTLVMFNNCHVGSAVKNALELIELLLETGS